MAIANANLLSILLVRAGDRICALPLESVIETMRPQPSLQVADTPAFIRGLAVIRGSPVPVVDLGMFFDGKNDRQLNRYVLARLGSRRVALAVREVIGLRRLDRSALEAFPPLLQDAYGEMVKAIEVRDQELHMLLQLSHVIPEDLWQRLESSEAMS